MQPRPNFAFCPTCRNPKSPNEVTCSKCGTRSCPKGHPLNSKICSLCGWEDRAWRPPVRVSAFDIAAQKSQGIPEVKENICPRCQVRTIFTLGRCVNCGFMLESGHPGGKQAEAPISAPRVNSLKPGQQHVVQQQFIGTYDAKLSYACPRCGDRTDPRSGSCLNCGYIGSMEYAMPKQQSPAGLPPAYTPPPPRQPSFTSQQYSPPRDIEQMRPCPFCSAPVPADSKFCQRCGKSSGSGRQHERYILATDRALSGAPISQLMPSMDTAAAGGFVQDYAGPYMPGADTAPVTERESRKEKGRARKTAGERKGFPVGLLTAIFVVAAALVAMVIFVVVQLFSSPSTPVTTVDTTPPKISGASVSNVVGSTAIIDWQTDKKATSQVTLCDPDKLCTYSPPDTSLVSNHSVKLDLTKLDIKLNVKYHITIESISTSGNKGSFEMDHTFSTAPPPPSPSPTTPPPEIPIGYKETNRAPDFTLKNLKGEDVSLNSLKGNIVMVNFWRVDCPPCLAEMPHIQSVSASWAGTKKLVVLAIYVLKLGDTAVSAQSTAQSYIDSTKYTFPVLIDANNNVRSAYNINGWPQTIFIDSSGVIKKINSEAFATKAEIETILNSIQ
jgi:peroxiredoxin